MKTTVVLLVLGLCLASCGDTPAPTTDAFPVPAWAKVAPEQIAEAKKHGVPVAFENDLGMRFVLIPAGTFLMGSPEDEEGRTPSETQHEVTLTAPYYMQITEVTNREYREYVDEPRLVGPNHNGDTQPVVRVTWEEAREFCTKLTEADPARSYRLPTEAEWEMACRAGTTTPYAFGTTISIEQANFHFNVGFPLPVGSFACNAWGLYDMHGNVSEWCSDRFERYGPDPVIDPQGPATDEWRVRRGGSYLSRHRAVRSADRDMYEPGDTGDYDIGFRLVSPLPEEP